MTVSAATRSMTQMEAHQITVGLIREHGLVGWSVAWDNARRRAGQCRYSSRTISLSRPLLWQRSYDDTMMTITHEIAHALVGPGHGHNRVWAAKHQQLGGNGQRCFEHFDESAPWVGRCDHGERFPRYRAPKPLGGWRCRCTSTGSPIVWARQK